MRAGRALRRIVMDRLIEQLPELAGRVYDRAAEDVPYPYITLGPSSWLDDSVECITAREQVVQVDVWGSGNKGALEDLVDDAAAALDGWADVDALTMHPLRVVMAQVMDDPTPGVIHGVVQVEAAVEG